MGLDTISIVGAILWALNVVYLPFFVIFYRNRNIHPIKGRMPWVILVFFVICLGFTSWAGVVTIWGLVDCRFETVVSFLFTYACMYFYNYRLLCLLFAFEVTKNIHEFSKGVALKDWKENWYTRNRHLIKTTFMLKIFLFFLFLIAIFFLLMILFLTPPQLVNGTCSSVLYYQLYQSVFFVMAAGFVLSSAIIAYKLNKHHRDAFEIKKEFVWCFYASIGNLVAYTVILLLQTNQALTAVFTLLLFHGVFTTAAVGPAWRSLQEIKRLQDENAFLNLADLLRSEQGLVTFLAYLQTEFSSENLIFWQDVERFHQLSPSNVSLIKSQANEIYRKYIKENAPCLLNVRDGVKIKVKNLVDQYEKEDILPADYLTLFDEAQDEIYKLMASDPYPRFQRTKPFEALSVLKKALAPHHSLKSAGSLQKSLKTNKSKSATIVVSSRLFEGDLPMDEIKQVMESLHESGNDDQSPSGVGESSHGLLLNQSTSSVSSLPQSGSGFFSSSTSPNQAPASPLSQLVPLKCSTSREPLQEKRPSLSEVLYVS